MPRFHLDEDASINDIREMVEKRIIAENKRIMDSDGILEKTKETWIYFNPGEDVPTDDELVVEAMGTWHVCFPAELQVIEH